MIHHFIIEQAANGQWVLQARVRAGWAGEVLSDRRAAHSVLGLWERWDREDEARKQPQAGMWWSGEDWWGI